MTGSRLRGYLWAYMDALERFRTRLRAYLDDRTSSRKLRQKALAQHLKKSEAWLSNVLDGKRGFRLVDLDLVADFFRVPPSELIRENNTELVEVTPTERTLLRTFRRADSNLRNSILTLAGLQNLIDTKEPAWSRAERTRSTRKEKPAEINGDGDG